MAGALYPHFRATAWRAFLPVILAIGWSTGLAVAPVAAEQGNVGEHSTPVYCWGTTGEQRKLEVGAPDVKASVVDHPGVILIGNQHQQWAAFRAHVYYSTDQVNWQWAVSGPWFATQVGDSINSLYSEVWWNYDTQQNEAPQIANTFDLYLSGFYRVAVEYYWWADEYTDSGYDFIWANNHEDFNSANPYADSCLGVS